MQSGMSGFEIAGLAGTLKENIELIRRITSIVKSYITYEEDSANLGASLQRLGFALGRILDNLNRLAITSQDGQDSSLSQLLQDQEESLSRLQKKLERKIATMQSATGGIASKSAWAIWRRKDFVLLENELEKWVSGFHLILASISTTEASPRGLQSPYAEPEKVHYRCTLSLFDEFGQTESAGLPDPIEHPPEKVEVIQEEFEIGLARVGKERVHIVEFVHYDANERQETLKELVRQVVSTAKGLC